MPIYTSAFVVLMASMALFANANAQPQGQVKPGLILAVSEGTSGGADHQQLVRKYEALAQVIEVAIRKNVVVLGAREFSLLEKGMKEGAYDFVIARPSDYSARGIRDYGYKYVASAKPEGQCHIILPKNSPIKSLEQAKGKRWVLPEQTAYMSRFCRAELRDKGIDLARENVQYVREQAAVGFYLESGFGDIGAVASYSGLAKGWEKAGGITLHKSVAQPYSPLIAGKRVSADEIAKIQAALKANQAKGESDMLRQLGFKEFDTNGEDKLKALLHWLEK